MTPRVVVIGAGAAGMLTAARLLEQPFPLDVVILEASTAAGGVAYSTPHECHLLNVPAGRMGADPREPAGFLRWLHATGRSGVGATDFVPRAWYGRYLDDHLHTVAEDPRTSSLTRVRGKAVDVTRAGTVRLATGRAITADAVVLATGSFAPGTDWAPTELKGSAFFVADPGVPGALDGIPRTEDVLVVGTGLTMADLVVLLDDPRRVVHAVSRRGLLPRAHRPAPVSAAPSWIPAEDADLAALRADMAGYLKTNLRRHRDWRAAFDGFRPHTAGLWARLSEEDKALFLSGVSREWDVRRHRLPPEVAARLTELRRAGRLRIHRGEVTGVRGSHVELSGGTIQVAAVLNCTGPHHDLRTTGDPLVSALLRGGLARPGPLGIGFDTAFDGALLPGRGSAPAPLWTLGAPRRGNLWESTAIPEIRSQAGALAETVLRALERKHTYAVRELVS